MKPLENNENITETTSKTEFNSLKEEDKANGWAKVKKISRKFSTATIPS